MNDTQCACTSNGMQVGDLRALTKRSICSRATCVQNLPPSKIRFPFIRQGGQAGWRGGKFTKVGPRFWAQKWARTLRRGSHNAADRKHKSVLHNRLCNARHLVSWIPVKRRSRQWGQQHRDLALFPLPAREHSAGVVCPRVWAVSLPLIPLVFDYMLSGSKQPPVSSPNKFPPHVGRRIGVYRASQRLVGDV